MCAGVRFSISNIPEVKLKKYFNQRELDFYKKRGEIDIFFFSKKPFLPIQRDDRIDLVTWGNRDKNFALPQTGWARQESVEAGKWDYLKLQKVEIPARMGYEKGVWFKVDGIGGVEIKSGRDKRVYMLTQKASPRYRKLTGHDREPVWV